MIALMIETIVKLKLFTIIYRRNNKNIIMFDKIKILHKKF